MGNIMGMGYAQGETPPVLHGAYVDRLSEDEIKRYTEGFRRICRVEGANSSATNSSVSSNSDDTTARKNLANEGKLLPTSAVGNGVAAVVDPTVGLISNNGSGLTKKLFRNKILGGFTMIPHALSDRLFEVLDVDHTGELSMMNVLSGIAWLKHGTSEEHARLLFIIYDLDSTGVVARDVLDRFMDVIYGRKRARHPTTVAFLTKIFNGRSGLTLDEFRQVVMQRDERDDALLILWLEKLANKIGIEEDTEILALEKTYNPVVIRHRIAATTQFTMNEVTTLERHFQRLFDMKGGASARVPSKHFVEVLSRHKFPKAHLERFCSRTGSPQMVLFDEFCQFLSNFCRGTVESKSRHLFAIYSEPESKQISLQSVKQLIQLGEYCMDEEGDSVDHIRDEENKITKIMHEDVSWSEDSFVQWSKEAAAIQQLLDQMAFAACILFGIKPDSPFLEKRIVEWHWKQSTRVFRAGQSWNLVGATWWRSWCTYTGMNQMNGTPRGALAFPNIPRAVRSMSDSSSRDYQSLESESQSTGYRPGPIANWSLLKRSGSRRLKEKLIVSDDFYMVPSAVYTVLVSWYSGGPDLSRSIVELPNSVFQIEMFPLVLRVGRVDSANGGVIMSGEEVIVSELSTYDSLLEATCRALLLLKFIQKARLWYFVENNPEQKIRLRKDHHQGLKKLTQDSVFLLELQDEDGSWPLSQSNDKISLSPSSRSVSKGTSVGGSDDEEYDTEDEGTAKTPTRQRSNGNSNRRQRDHRPSLRTSDICSRGNLESLTSLGSGHNNSSTGDNNNVGSSNTENSQDGEEEGMATASTLRKRFSKDAFKGHGLVGLDNLGNTCYMSSALQCLSHTRLLVEYFKNEAYLKDINLHNRDGTNGKLAIAFGELLRILWTSDKKRFAPTEFKRVLAKFNPQFTGSNQHDAQELLACLLSSLSEDLNRVMTKPYTEQPDSDGRCDTLVAGEWWQNHLKREVSVIVALFTGQYKSLLECSVCRYESARFEPFTFLQLSLPESNYRSIVLTVIFSSDKVPMKYSVRVKNTDTIQEVKHQMALLFQRMEEKENLDNHTKSSQENIEARLVVARISSLHIIDVILDGKTPLSQIHEKDQLTVFQLDSMDDICTPPLSVLDFSHENGMNGTSEDISKNFTGYVAENGNLTPSPGSARHIKNGICDLNDEVEEQDEPAIPIGASVYVRADKTKDFSAARVIGSSVRKGTVDVAYPSGIRRYHIPLSKVLERRRDEAFIFLVHRRVERSTNCFTNAHITRLFGAPLVLRVSLRATTAYNLYMLVWKRLRRIFNWQHPPAPSELDVAMGTGDCHSDLNSLLNTDTSTIALGNHLGLTKFGFCLRMVTSHGTGCSRCEWIEGCLGCVIVPSPHETVQLAAEETIAIDWDIRTLKEEYDPIQASKMDFDESVQHNKKQDNMPLNLHHCMDIFTAKEHIPEAYCSRCKTIRPATKTMDLWRLPPILVIQLKRFCYTQVSRRKLHHLVDFPLRGLQLEAFVAKQREPRRLNESGLTYWRFLGGKLKEEQSKIQTPNGAQDDNDELVRPVSTRQKSMSLLDAPATAAVRADDGFLYDLYAVVNHVGALGAGHYFAYVLSEHDGKWKCFNDHQCKDIDEKEVVSSTAYILFYRRRDTQNVSIEELFPPIVAKANGTHLNGNHHDSKDQAQVEQLVEQSKLATSGSTCTIH